jgi:hypothetical protein
MVAKGQLGVHPALRMHGLDRLVDSWQRTRDRLDLDTHWDGTADHVRDR